MPVLEETVSTQPETVKDQGPETKSRRPDPIAEDVVIDAKLGDDYSRKRVALAYMPMIRDVAGRYARQFGLSRDQLEDLIQDGIIVLYRSIKNWDPEPPNKTPVSFAGYVKLELRHELRFTSMSMKGYKRNVKRDPNKPVRRHRMVFLDKPLGEDESAASRDIPDAGMTPEDIAIVRDEQVKNVGLDTLLRRHVETLPGLRGRVVRDYFILHLKKGEIAKRVGLNIGTVSSYIGDAVKRMAADPEIRGALIATHKPAPPGVSRHPHAE